MATIENKCTCKSDFQDKEYGQSVRLFNLNEKHTAKCTVCGTIIKTSDDSKKKR